MKDDDWLSLLCGKAIARGSARVVYSCALDNSVVVKLDRSPGYPIQNILEYDLWQQLSLTPDAAWLAPCHRISNSGRLLIQRRTSVARLDDYPEKLPTWFTDTKRENFGMLDGKLVCHDYGFTLPAASVSKSKKKVDWWSND